MDYVNYSGAMGAILGAALISIIVAVALYVVTSFFLAKLFAKAGVEGTWRAWVPIYNMMIFSMLGDLSPWLVLYGFIGALLLSWIGIGFIFSIAIFLVTGLAAWRIGMKLGQEQIMVILWILPFVWLIVMSGKKTPWNINIPPAPWAGNSFLANNVTWEGVPSQNPGPEIIADVEIIE